MRLECSTSTASTPASKDLEIYTESWKLLEKITDIEKSIQRTPTNRSETLTPFLEWMIKHDVEMGPVELTEIPFYGCCVRAVKQVKSGELLFSIPQKLMLSTQTATSSNIGMKSLSQTVYHALTYPFTFYVLGHFINNDPILSQMPNVALAFHVLNELYDSKSFWKPYLDALPSSYDTVMYFSPDEITELKGSPAFGKLL